MLCLYCLERETPPDRPDRVLCTVCVFAVRAHIEHGLRQLDAYLASWAEFSAWERVH